MSKCSRGGLHHPPALLGMFQFGRQKLVAIIMIKVPCKHHCGTLVVANHFVALPARSTIVKQRCAECGSISIVSHHEKISITASATWS